jgi:hypothetical protein
MRIQPGAPVLIWNMGHDWASLRFQGERLNLNHTDTPFALHLPFLGTPLDLMSPLSTVLALAGKLTPWIFVPLVLTLVEAFASRRADERRLLFLCLGGPMISFFLFAPIFGVTAGKGWSLPGVFFLYPLLGDWIRRKAPQWKVALGKVAFGTVLALAFTLVIIASNDKTGWIAAKVPFMDKAALRFTSGRAFSHLAENEIFGANADFQPEFVISQMDYSASAKLAIALGPSLPVLSSVDSHSLYYIYDQSAWIGRDGVIVGQRVDADALRSSLSPWFAKVDAPIDVSVANTLWTQKQFVLIRAHGLKMPFPFRSL